MTLFGATLAVGAVTRAFAANVDLVTTVRGPTDLTISTPYFFTINVKNVGADDAVGQNLTILGAFSAYNWTCVHSPGASCTASGSQEPGVTILLDTVTIPAGGEVQYVLTMTTGNTRPAPGAFGIAAFPAAGYNDANFDDNLASLSFNWSPRGDASITIDDGKYNIPSGATTSVYTIVASSTGRENLANATVDATPDGLPAATASWTCVGSVPAATCGGGGVGAIHDTVNIPTGAFVTYTMTVQIPAGHAANYSVLATIAPPAGFDDAIWGSTNNTATDTDWPQAAAGQADVHVTISNGVQSVWNGQALTYTIVMKNAGPADIVNGTAAAIFLAPSTWTCVPSGPAGSSCPASGSAPGGMSEPVTVKGGGTLTYTLTHTANHDPLLNGAPAGWNAAASLTPQGGVALGGDTDAHDDTPSDSDLLSWSADLSVTMTGGASSLPGAPVDYTITVVSPPTPETKIPGGGNLPYLSFGHVVDFALPAGLTDATWTCGGGCSTFGTGSIHDPATFAERSNGDRTVSPVVYKLHATVAANASGPLVATATVTPRPDTRVFTSTYLYWGAFHDPNLANNSVSIPSSVLGNSDLSLTNTLQGSLTAGSNATYLVKVSNGGPGAALSRITVTDTLPAGVTFVSATGPGWSCSAAGQTVTCTTDDDLAAGASSTITLVVAVPASALGSTLTNTASVSNSETDATSADRTASAAATVVAPGAGGGGGNGGGSSGRLFTALDPVRVFDTRPDQPQGSVAVVQQKYGGTNVLKVKIAGSSGVPAAGAGAVSLNVTVVDPSAPGYVTVFPCGIQPTVSSLNYVTGQTVPNAVIAPLSADGEVCFFSQSDTHLIADVNGWFATGAGFTALDPSRVFDTRDGQPQGTVAVAQSKVGGANVLKVKFAGASGVPASGAGAVSLNVTVVGPGGPGYVTVFPCGVQPTVSSLNYVTGQTVPNAVIAPLSADGEVCFFSQVDTDLIADVNGWFATGSGFTPLDPVRVFDTRPDQPQGSVAVTQQKYGGGNILKVKFTGASGVPATGAGAVSLNVTAVDPVGAGYVTVFPCGAQPTVSSLNYVTGQTVPNAVIAPLSPNGEVCFFSQVDTHLITDVNGWFAN
jgi:uncharacterized repeat protein (TIGR01451 family)